MKKNLIISLFGLSLVASASAAVMVSDVTAKQRWPFSGKVDFDFSISGEDAIAVDYFVSYDGSDGWQRLDPGSLVGDVESAKVGACHAVWDPSLSGLGGKTLTGFSAKVEAASFDDRKFIVVDLQNGGWAYASAAPAGGWTQNEYKSTKMVFRRIPGGDYTVGHPTTDMSGRWGGYSSAGSKALKERSVRISSDYYIAIFNMTTYQRTVIDGGAVTSSYRPETSNMTYVRFRGSTNAEDGVNWPLTKFKVAPSSLLGKIRAKVNNELTIDLPTETQWEVAMRAGTTTIFPAGGAGTDSNDDLWTYFNVHSLQGATDSVGLKPPTQWDIYDPLGMVNAWTLDACSIDDKGDQDLCIWTQDGTDPIGRQFAAGDEKLRRIQRGIGWGNATMTIFDFPGLRKVKDDSSAVAAARFCIHLDTAIAD